MKQMNTKFSLICSYLVPSNYVLIMSIHEILSKWHEGVKYMKFVEKKTWNMILVQMNFIRIPYIYLYLILTKKPNKLNDWEFHSDIPKCYQRYRIQIEINSF